MTTMLSMSPFGLPVVVVAPRPAPPPAPSGWRIQERPGTGLFVVSDAGTLLFRLEPAQGLILPWDKKTGREIAIPVALLPIG